MSDIRTESCTSPSEDCYLRLFGHLPTLGLTKSERKGFRFDDETTCFFRPIQHFGDCNSLLVTVIDVDTVWKMQSNRRRGLPYVLLYSRIKVTGKLEQGFSGIRNWQFLWSNNFRLFFGGGEGR